MPPAALGVGAFVRYDFVTTCEASGDMVSCTSGRDFVGPQLTPRFRLSPAFSVGALAAYGVTVGSESKSSDDGGREERSLTAYRLELEGRLHVLPPDGADLWLGVDAGLSVVRDVWHVYDSSDRFVRTRGEAELGPIVGIALGVDFAVADEFLLGPELRGALITGENGLGGLASLVVGGSFLVGP